jgi:hypothetical protein
LLTRMLVASIHGCAPWGMRLAAAAIHAAQPQRAIRMPAWARRNCMIVAAGKPVAGCRH